MAAGSIPPVAVRVAELEDLDGVVAVGRAAWPVTYGPILGDDLVEMFLTKWWTREACTPAIRTGRTLVVERDGKIAGTCSYGPHDGREVIWKLYVHPDHHGHGIGAALLAAVVERVHDTAPAVYLSFSDGNHGAERFTRAHGFVEVHREDQGSMPDLVWMRLDLGSVADADTHDFRDRTNGGDAPDIPDGGGVTTPEGDRA